jgi:hypothetical protein
MPESGHRDRREADDADCDGKSTAHLWPALLECRSRGDGSSAAAANGIVSGLA